MTHELGPDDGTVEVRTYREGVAQKVGHDLVIAVTQWQATVGVGAQGAVESVELTADSRSLEVREGHNGLKPLSDKDRRDIKESIDAKVLRGEPIRFSSGAVEPRAGGLTAAGDLTLAGQTRPATFALETSPEGRVQGTLEVTQSQWGIKPYKAFMGALKVRDTVEIVIDVQLPGAGA